jgi:putative spermidine/putrescine transport system substrate-binding protein
MPCNDRFGSFQPGDHHIPMLSKGRVSISDRRFSRRVALAAAGAGILPVLAGCSFRGDPTAPTATSVAPAGTPTIQVQGFIDPSRWAGRTLRVGAWGGEIQTALRDRVWNPFALATGCSVQELTTDFSQLAASYRTNSEPYTDVLLVDAFWAYGALDRGETEPVPAEKIPPERFAPVVKIDGAVPAFTYAMVNAYRRDFAEQSGAPTPWQRWWDTSALPGARTLPKGPLGTFEFALLADGVPRDQLYPLDGARAIEKLKVVSGSIVDRWWETGEQPLLWMSREQVQLGTAWHYRAIAAQQDGRPIDFVWDDALLVADHWVVPKASPSVDVALDFLAYATTPEIQASLAATVPLGPINPDAFALIDPKTAQWLPTAPDNVAKVIQADASWWSTNKVEANERFNSWLLGVPMHES